MPGRLAIIACGGALPVQIAASNPDALLITLAGVPHNFGTKGHEYQLEKIGSMFAAMKSEGIARVVFAGSLSRPALNPADFDPVMIDISPRLLAAMQQGDNALLTQVIDVFEEQGFSVIGAHELLPELTAQTKWQVGPVPDAKQLADADRAWDILQVLSPLDVGQGCVVADEQCLGIETLQGTDSMLKYVASTPGKQPLRGVFVKAAKREQDLRVDMPAIGPGTIDAVVRAGLAGVMIEAGKVMILEREKTLTAVDAAGIFLMARDF